MNDNLHVIAKLEYGKLIGRLANEKAGKIQIANRIPPGGHQQLAVLKVYLDQAEQCCRGYASIWQELLATDNGGYLTRPDVDFINAEIAKMTHTQNTNLLNTPQVPRMASSSRLIQQSMDRVRASIKTDLEILFRKQTFPKKKELEPMVKPKEPATIQPTLSPDKAIPILEGMIIKSEKLLSTESNTAERKQWIHTGKGLVIAALGNTHPNVNEFDKSQLGSYYPGITDEDIRQQHNEQLEKMVAVLKSTVEQLRWQLPDPTQVFIPAGSPHDAYLEIRKIIELAASEILIVDTYVDGTLCVLLTNLPGSTKIRIMTMKMKGDFALEGKKFVAQHGNTVEVRQTMAYHDRFVVVDSYRIWHLGASIKDAGNKAFGMSEFISQVVVSSTKADVEATWNAATRVPL